jgi:hypothetical protein
MPAPNIYRFRIPGRDDVDASVAIAWTGTGWSGVVTVEQQDARKGDTLSSVYAPPVTDSEAEALHAIRQWLGERFEVAMDRIETMPRSG